MALVAPIGDPSFQAFIYPLEDPDDPLIFDLYPDQTKVSRGTHTTETGNSAGRDIVQVGGLKAVSQSHTLIFDDTLGHENDMEFMGARDAEHWIENWLGRRALPGRRNIFRTNLLSEYPMWCAIKSQGSEVLYAPAGIVRVVKWDLQLQEVPTVAIDPMLFGAARKRGKGKPKTRKDKAKEDQRRQTENEWAKNSEIQEGLAILKRRMNPVAFRLLNIALGNDYMDMDQPRLRPVSSKAGVGPASIHSRPWSRTE